MGSPKRIRELSDLLKYNSIKLVEETGGDITKLDLQSQTLKDLHAIKLAMNPEEAIALFEHRINPNVGGGLDSGDSNFNNLNIE